MQNLCPLYFSDFEKLLNISSPLNDHLDFIKTFQFSTDGKFSIASTESNNVLINTINEYDIYNNQYYESSFQEKDEDSSHQGRNDIKFDNFYKKIFVGESIYDIKWNPNVSDKSSFIVTSRDHPIQLWDVHSEAVCSSYHGRNHLDELDSSISLAFNMQGSRIYAGYNRMIRSFDIEYPGENCIQTATSETRKSPYGQKGLISALAFNPDYSGSYAAGSYAHSLGIYVENMSEHVMLFDNIQFGVTCLRWSPCGNYLWTGGRNHSKLYCWDIRFAQNIVGDIDRCLTTNQKMSFDIDPWGKYLCTGTQDKKILFYDTLTFQMIKSIDISNHFEDVHCANFNKQFSCVNSVMFHPYSAMIGASVGERYFSSDSEDSESDEEEEALDRMLITNNNAVNDKNEHIEFQAHNHNIDITNSNNNNLNNMPHSTLSLWGIPRIPIKHPNHQTKSD